jgi:hypothetical protein
VGTFNDDITCSPLDCFRCDCSFFRDEKFFWKFSLKSLRKLTNVDFSWRLQHMKQRDHCCENIFMHTIRFCQKFSLKYVFSQKSPRKNYCSSKKVLLSRKLFVKIERVSWILRQFAQNVNFWKYFANFAKVFTEKNFRENWKLHFRFYPNYMAWDIFSVCKYKFATIYFSHTFKISKNCGLCSLWDPAYVYIHCKKRLAIFPSPPGMSLTKLSLTGNNLIIPCQREFGQWHPGWGRENR